MDNDAKFTRGWRAAIVLALLISASAAGVKFTIGTLTIGPAIDGQESAQTKKERELEERIKKIEAYLYEKGAPKLEAEKAPKEP